MHTHPTYEGLCFLGSKPSNMINCGTPNRQFFCLKTCLLGVSFLLENVSLFSFSFFFSLSLFFFFSFVFLVSHGCVVFD